MLRLKDKSPQAHIASFVPICKLCKLRTFRTFRVLVLRTSRTSRAFRNFSIFTLHTSRTSRTSRTFFISALRTSRTFCTLVFLRFVLFVLSVLLASQSVAVSAFWSFGTSAVLEGACMTWSPLKEIPLVHTPGCNHVEARRPLANLGIPNGQDELANRWESHQHAANAMGERCTLIPCYQRD